MLTYPALNPVALTLGPVHIHWYGVMYLLGFAAAWALGRYRAVQPNSGWTAAMVDDVIFYSVIGTLIGGRLGYMLFYGLDQIRANPLSILHIWHGGMAFHGGLIGVMTALALYARRFQLPFFHVTDFIAPLVPVGLFTGRMGNFINGELWGHPTTLPWGMQLPCAQFPEYCATLPLTSVWSMPLHPSQLYQAALEGMALFTILWLFSRRPRPLMAISGAFLVCYGIFRFSVEFVRMPDAHIGYLAFHWLTMGQLLTLPMLIGGGILLIWAYRRASAT